MSNRRRIALVCASLVAICLLAVVGLSGAGAAGGEPAEDHLVVSDIPTVGTAQAVRIERFGGTGISDGQDWFLPAAAGGANHPFTLQGTSSAVGALARSADGRFVTAAGYTAPVGGIPESTEPRVVARVNAVGGVDTTTTLGNAIEKEKIRGAATNDGSGFWVTGNGKNGTKGGLFYAPLGNAANPTVIFSETVPTAVSNKALNNTRSVQIAGGSIYTASEKGSAGVYKVAGLPTTATAPTNIIPFTGEVDSLSEAPLESVPGTSGVDTIYLVKEGSGIYKYALEAGTWNEKGQVVAGTFGPLTVKVDAEGHFRIYAIKLETVGTEEVTTVVRYTDSAAATAAPSVSAPAVVATAPTGTAYRGIAFAPTDSTLAAEVPGPPTAVAGTAANEAVELSWTAPGAPGASAISEYLVTPFVAGVPKAPIHTGSTATNFSVAGLTNGTAYTFTVAAINGNGTGPESTLSTAVTPQSAGAPTPTIALGAPNLEGTNGDPTNPTDSVTVGQTGTDAGSLTVTVLSSSNPAVAATGDVAVTGTGATRTVAVTPAGGVGYTEITLQVEGTEAKKATTVLRYAASAPAPDPTAARFLTGAADASTAIPVGDGYLIVGDDENNVLRLYRGDTSGAPVKTWNFDAQMGNPEEIDIEAAARAGSTIYWTGSMGNSKSGNLKPDRSTLFTTTVSGSGASTELTFGGYYKGLRGDLIAWDEANSDRFGFAAGAAQGRIPKEIGGFNVEGLEFAGGSTSTAYIGFRAPLAPAIASGEAVVVPVTNIDQLAASGHNTTVHATFGTPLLWNLGGLSVREISKNAAGQYLILAGSYAAGGEFALYTWDGIAADAPVRTLTSLPGETGGEDPGSWETIGEVPAQLVDGASVQLVMDNGSTDYYGDGQEAKALAPELQKSRSEPFAIELAQAPVDTVAPVASGEALVGSTLSCTQGTWTGAPAPTYSYEWQREGVAIIGATGTTYATTTDDAGKGVRCAVTATNSAGSATAVSNSITVAAAGANGGGGSTGGGSSGGGSAGPSPSPTPVPTIPATRAPIAKISTPSGPVGLSGDSAKVGKISCGPGACAVTAGTATLTIGGKKVGVKVVLPKKIGSDPVAIRVVLPKFVREALRSGTTAKVRIRVKLKGPGGKTVTRTVTARIRSNR